MLVFPLGVRPYLAKNICIVYQQLIIYLQNKFGIFQILSYTCIVILQIKGKDETSSKRLKNKQIMTEMKETPLSKRVKIKLREYEAVRARIMKECAIVEKTYYNWMEGETIPSIAKKQQLAEILGCTVEEIFPEGKEEVNG